MFTIRILHLVSLTILFLFITARCERARADEPGPTTRLSGTLDLNNALRITTTADATATDLLTDKVNGGQLILNFQPEMVNATYLGVETTEADDTLRAQLKLPEGVGLAVK